MRLNAFRTENYSFYPGIITSDEIIIKEPMEFVIDTGAVTTTVSAYYFNNNLDISSLDKGRGVVGIGGYQEKNFMKGKFRV